MKYDKRKFIEFSKQSIKSSTAHLYARLILNLHYTYKIDMHQNYDNTKQLLSLVKTLVKSGALSKKYLSAWNKLLEFKKQTNVS